MLIDRSGFKPEEVNAYLVFVICHGACGRIHQSHHSSAAVLALLSTCYLFSLFDTYWVTTFS